MRQFPMRSIMKFNAIIFLVPFFLCSTVESPEWTELLDKDLNQWETYLSFRHKVDYNGSTPVDSNGNLVQPIGYNKDETKVFSVIEEQGRPVLKISGEIYGCLFTKTEYENYHLKLKVRWGENKFDPRKTKLKDSGILYHSIGEAGAEYWRSWMLSQEFQIMEGHMGDFWSQANSAIDIRSYLSEGIMNCVANEKQPFRPFGADSSDKFCMRAENNETPNNGWTILELICFKGQSLHIVNGKVAMVLKNSRYVKDGQSFPMTKGKIQLQSEAAEVYFKDIVIKELTEMPAKYQGLF
jgi:hypothetical protein